MNGYRRRTHCRGERGRAGQRGRREISRYGALEAKSETVLRRSKQILNFTENLVEIKTDNHLQELATLRS